MAIVRADVTRNPNELTSQNLLSMFEAGQQKRQTDFSNLALRGLGEHDADESTRWGITELVAKGGGTQADLEAKLKPQMDRYRAALAAQNEATGRRLTDAQLDKEVQDYFSRYFLWGQSNGLQMIGKDMSQSNQAPASQTQAQASVAPQVEDGLTVTPPDGGFTSAPDAARRYAETELLRRAAMGASAGLIPRADDAQPGAPATPSVAVTSEGAGGRLAPSAEMLGLQKTVPPAQAGVERADILASKKFDPSGAYYQAIADHTTFPPMSLQEYKDAIIKAYVTNGFSQAEANKNAGIFVQLAAKEYADQIPSGGFAAKSGQAMSTKITGLPMPSFIEGYEDGATVTGPTVAIVGEGGEDEYIVPKSKALEWARMVLSNPKNIPNPADLDGKYTGPAKDASGIPMFRGGAAVKPVYPDGTKSGLESAALQPATPAAGTAATAAPAATKPAAPPALTGLESSVAIVQGKTSMVDDNMFARAVAANPSVAPKAGKYLEKAKVDEKVRALSSSMRTPAFRDARQAIDQDFATWFKNATPEELSLWRGMEGAATQRANSNELALKWKYYQLQERAAGGDEESAQMQILLDFAEKYLNVNKKVIEEKGIAKAMADDPNLLTMYNFIGAFYKVPPKEIKSGWFGRKSVVDQKASPMSSGYQLSPEADLVFKEATGR